MLSILVVEDDRRVRRELESIVREFGAVTEAATRSEAEHMLTEGSYQMILVDLALPDGSGLELLDSCAGLREAPAIVVVSSTLNIVARNECLTRGAADFISKPFHPAELARRLERVMAAHNHGEQGGSESLASMFSESSLSRLSPREREVLVALSERPLSPVSVGELARKAGVRGPFAGPRVRRVVRRLRRVLEDSPGTPEVIADAAAEPSSGSSRVVFVPPQRR